MVLSVLSECGWLKAEDVVQGLRDPSPAVRHQAMMCLSMWECRCRKTFVPQEARVADTDGGAMSTKGRGPGYEVCMIDRLSRETLIPALIDGLEDPHPMLRDMCYDYLVRLVRAVKLRESAATQAAGSHPEGSYVRVLPPGWPTGLKPSFLVYDDWASRHAVVEQIRRLWSERSGVILAEAMKACSLVADR
jgi:hypothetical protein